MLCWTTRRSRATPTRWPIDRDDDRSSQGGYRAIAPRCARAAVGDPCDVSGRDDPPDVSDALALVTRHLTPAEATQNRAQRELALARLLQRTSLLVLERVEQVLQRPGRPSGAKFDDDPIGEAVLVANLQRLIRVNPDRKTLANLLSTAIKGVEIKSQRRPTGSDARNPCR
jgi:hypothetical protein